MQLGDLRRAAQQKIAVESVFNWDPSHSGLRSAMRLIAQNMAVKLTSALALFCMILQPVTEVIYELYLEQ
ncbi:hypothetical protein E6O75_ATG07070 [Venturia nashicola]|uniref:Uncharacterized protein n=1 Tax=Venturia nashicola TaxID=86259 RepID=A0A4Z1NX94_9PEZI|nr:hypothetical protein E6O75_ATG07070 [Venturia nashicola]